MSLACAVLAAVLYGVASTSQAWAARRAEGPAVVRHPAYLAGLMLDGVAWAVSLMAMASLPLFVVQSVLASSLAVTAVLVALVLHVRLRARDVVAVAVLVPALGLLASLATEGKAQVPSGFTVGLWIGVLVAAVAGLALYRRGAFWLQAVVGGLGFSGAALGARALEGQVHEGLTWSVVTTVVASPLAWAVAASGLVGVLLYARSMERGSPVAATAILWGVEVVVPAGVGVAVLGDAVRRGDGILAVVVLGLVLVASGVLATSPAQS